MPRPLILAFGLLAVAPSAAHAAFVTFDSKGAYLAAAGATDATGPLPTTPFTGPLPPRGYTETPITVGSVTYITGRYVIDEWTPRLPGNEYVVSWGLYGNGQDDFDLVPAAPVYALGFDFVEPQFDSGVNGPFVDSTFEFTLRNNGVSIGSFTFNAPNDTATFVGVWSSLAFDRVFVRELSLGGENEFVGRVYTGNTPFAPAAVPEPASVALLGTGVVGLLGYARRRAVRA